MGRRQSMLEIKTFSGDWKEVTREDAEAYYKRFCETATEVAVIERHNMFNKNHLRGGHVMLNGRIETDEEKKARVFQIYKNNLMTEGKVRFLVIEYECHTPVINPFEMAVALKKDGVVIVFDDSTISKEENAFKMRKVDKLFAKAMAE